MKLRQSFVNSSGAPQFITLELSTSRFRLEPGQEALLYYDSADVQDELGSALRIEFVDGELIVWTHEEDLFAPDGRPLPHNYDLAEAPTR